MSHVVIPMTEPAEPIGRVIAVSAAQIIVLLRPRGLDAPPSEPLEMAALVKVRTRGAVVFGMISGLRVPLPSLATPEDDLKIVEIELIGETCFTPSATRMASAAAFRSFRRSRIRFTSRPRRIWRKSTRRRAKPRCRSVRSTRMATFPPTCW